MKLRIVLLVVLTTLLAPAVASAKGAVGATATGAGLDGPVTLDLTDRWELVGDLGLYELVYGATGGARPDVESTRPAGELGPAVVLSWDVLTGPDTTAVVRQEVYPFAEGGPVTHVAPGQAVGEQATLGGWWRAPGTVADGLRAAGVPIERPEVGGAPSPGPSPAPTGTPSGGGGWIVAAAVGAAGAVALAVAGMAARRRWHPAPA